MSQTIEEKIFALVKQKGNTLEGALHIIETTSEDDDTYNQSFRVYHKDGYCFDVRSYWNDNPDEPIIMFEVYTEWEGFKKIELEDLYNLIRNSHE